MNPKSIAKAKNAFLKFKSKKEAKLKLEESLREEDGRSWADEYIETQSHRGD